MRISVTHWRAKEPPLPGAYLVGASSGPLGLRDPPEVTDPHWEVEVRDLDHLMELASEATVGFTRFARHPTRKERRAGAPEFSEITMIVDDKGKRFQQM